MALRSWRLSLLLAEHAPPFPELCYLQCLCGAIGSLTPARMGEAAKVELLRRDHQVPLGDAVLCFGVEKSQDVAWYGIAGLVSLVILGLHSPATAAVRSWVVPAALVLMVVAGGVLAVQVWRRSQGVAHLGRVLGASVLVLLANFGVCYIVFLWHGRPGPFTALAIYSFATLAGVLSALPGGQGVVQFAFHGAAVELFGMPEDVTRSMVVHLTFTYYLGVASSVLLAWLLRRATRRAAAASP
jgi:uncharacterized membrane protein YbhN (UPF0104 family)